MGNRSYFVICVSGMMSSGKTSLIMRLTELLQGSVPLLWDDYDHLLELEISDFKKWVETGCDTNKYKTTRFTEDLRKLRNGSTIENPITNMEVKPGRYIIVEDPTGRTREEMKRLIDYLVFLQVPLEISLARTYSRELKNRQKYKDAEELLQYLESFTDRYLDWYHKALQNLEKRIREDADLILDGQKTSHELAEILKQKIKEKTGS
jgi:uridine kinase